MINAFLYLTINVVIYFIISTSLLYVVSDVFFANVFLIVILILALINFISQYNIKYKRYVRKSLSFTYFILFVVLLIPINNIAKFHFVGAWLLLGYILSNELFSTTHSKMKLQFKFSFCILSIMVLLAIYFNCCMLALKQVFIYIIMYYILAISINRCLRDEENVVDKKQYYFKILIELTSALTIICIIYFTKCYKYILDIFLIIFDKVMQVFKIISSKIMIFLYFILRKFWEFLLIFKKDVKPQEIIRYEEKINKQRELLINIKKEPVEIIKCENHYEIFILIVILVLISGLLIWLYISNKKRVKNDKSITIVREKIKDSDKQSKKKKLFMNNVELVRYYYRKMLKSIKKRKIIKLSKNDTTLDINKKLIVKDYNKTSLLNIRKIYLKARYSDLELSREDVKNIKREINTNIKSNS